MLVKARENRAVTRVHRRMLRKLALCLLEEAYKQLLDGYAESFVCSTLGVECDRMEGALRPALEEALWERGYFRGNTRGCAWSWTQPERPSRSPSAY